MPRLATPDFSGVGDAFDGLRDPLGSLNPWNMGNDWLQRQLPGDPTPERTTHRGLGPHVAPTMAEQTPDYVREHAAEMGVPEQANRDFINEFIAHSVTGETEDGTGQIGDTERRSSFVARMNAMEEAGDTDNDEFRQWTQQRDLLQSWGIDPQVDADNEVYDEETGLYAVRYDAFGEDSEFYDPNATSVTSFAVAVVSTLVDRRRKLRSPMVPSWSSTMPLGCDTTNSSRSVPTGLR